MDKAKEGSLRRAELLPLEEVGESADGTTGCGGVRADVDRHLHRDARESQSYRHLRLERRLRVWDRTAHASNLPTISANAASGGAVRRVGLRQVTEGMTAEEAATVEAGSRPWLHAAME
jgi:hypothetical protein